MQYKQIPISEVFKHQNKNSLFELYSKESKVSTAPKHNPSIDVYVNLEKQGLLITSGYYVDNELVGFCVVSFTLLTHSTTLLSTIDAFYILPENRKFGSGNKLVKFAEKLAKNKGATVMVMTAPVNSRLSKVAESFGYKNTNLIYSKSLQ